MVSVQPLLEEVAKLIFLVPATVNKYVGFSRYDGLSLLKFQWNDWTGFEPVYWKFVMVLLQAKSQVKS